MTITQNKVSTHTPAPWKMSKSSARIHVFISDKESYVFSLKDEANARLIASAPELLEACKYALDVAEAHFLDVKDEGWDIDSIPYQGALNQIKTYETVIAKAEGKLP